jgi:hypothetical protein
MRWEILRDRRFWIPALLLTVAIELATVITRLALGQSAAHFNETTNPPLILKVHHPVYAAPLVVAGLFVRSGRLSRALWALVFALVASDVVHHLIVLPLWVGNTGWHWP